MAYVKAFLFGKFSLSYQQRTLATQELRKAQEILYHLLLNRRHPHLREVLATLFWAHNTTKQSKAYLRRALWQLQTAIREQLGETEQPIIVASSDWIQCNPSLDWWVDVEAFEHAYTVTKGIAGTDLRAAQAESLTDAVQLYTADLLEDCYQDWCLLERERLKDHYLIMLGKLAAYCEVQGQYEAGQEYAKRILDYDPAREHAHRQIMRLRFLAGHRTGAIRQYRRCVDVLRDELDLPPSTETRQLYQRIRGDGAAAAAAPASMLPPASTDDMLGDVKTALTRLTESLEQVRHEIRVLEERVRQHPS